MRRDAKKPGCVPIREKSGCVPFSGFLLVCGYLDPRATDHARQRDEWQRWAEQHGVRLLLNVLPWDLPPLYAAADIYLSLSTYEGDSLALGEAMAACCVPVVTRVGGVDEAVTDGINGFTAPAEDLDVLWRKLALAAALPWADLAAMGERARRAVVARSDLRSVVRDHELLYLGVDPCPNA